jgi:hypothetical protein
MDTKKKSRSKKKKEEQQQLVAQQPFPFPPNIILEPTTLPGTVLSSSTKREKKANAKKPSRKEHNPVVIEQVKITIVEQSLNEQVQLIQLENSIVEQVEAITTEENPVVEQVEAITKQEDIVNDSKELIDNSNDSLETIVGTELDMIELDSLCEENNALDSDIDDKLLFLDTPENDYYIYKNNDMAKTNNSEDLYRELVETNKILLNMVLQKQHQVESIVSPQQESITNVSGKLPRDLVDKIYMSCPNTSNGQKSKLLLYGFSDYREFIGDLKALFSNVIILDSLENVTSYIEKNDIPLMVVHSTNLTKVEFDKLINSNINIVKNYMLFQLSTKLYKTIVSYSNNFVLDFINIPGETVNDKKVSIANDIYYISINKPDIIGKLFVSTDKIAFQFISNVRVKIANIYYVYKFIQPNIVQLDNNKTIVFDTCFTNLKYIDMESYKTILASL